MLVLTLLTLLIATPLYSFNVSALQHMRLTAIALLFASSLSFNCYSTATLGSGVSLFSGLLTADSVTTGAEIFICIAASLALMPWPAISNAIKTPIHVTGVGLKQDLVGSKISITQTVHSTAIAEYAMLALFSTTGSLLLLAAADVISLYLAIELQSFAVYVLATSYRNNEAATAAGLKYFLLGALSSAIILLGTALLYKHTGLTNLHAIANLLSVEWSKYSTLSSVVGTMLGLVLIGVGLLFKVGAAPLHNWAPDVYDSVPTLVTTWLAVMPKIAVFIFMQNMCVMAAVTTGLSNSEVSLAINAWQQLLLLSAVLSLVIGTVLGLAQQHIKRLLAYSTVSHVGFMLVALACTCYSYTGVEAVNAMLFYLSQYTLTGLASFFVLLALGYVLKGQPSKAQNMQGNESDLILISSLKGHANTEPMLALSMLVCLLSIAGVPPIIGFFAKYNVLYVAMLNGHYAIALLGVVTSVISAAYYLRVIRVLYFDGVKSSSNESMDSLNAKAHPVPSPTVLTPHGMQFTKFASHTSNFAISSLHSYTIACLTMFMLLFMLQPTIMLNSTQLLAMTLFTG